MFAALALIVIGSLLLLSNLGYIKIANLAGPDAHLVAR